jgi:Ni/Co efflux regulator RcnB
MSNSRSMSRSQVRVAPMNAPHGGGWANSGGVRPGTNHPMPPRQWNGSHANGGSHGSWNGQRWVGGSRWGTRVDGRWYGGVQAPGGWNAYRRPYRGWTLPTYWYAPSFFINDFSAFGLGAPPSGYTWSRYYDDAVLVDGHGRVYDSVGGLDWDRYDGASAYDDGEGYYAEGGYDARDDRGGRDDGVGGAVIGGVLGGVAGNAIVGRGDKLAGTVIGAGAGAIAGAAIDRAEDRGRREDRRGYDDRGAPYGYPDRGPMPPRGYAPAPVIHHGGGYETRVYSSGGGYYGGSTTTVTVMPTTTTTTETITVYDDVRTYRAPVKRKIVRRAPSKILRRGCSC